jgi:hypothetical protein
MYSNTSAGLTAGDIVVDVKLSTTVVLFSSVQK